MFTVCDALALEVMGGACLVGGARGMASNVRWAHVVDVDEMARWVRGGELVLSTALSWHADSAAQRTIVGALYEKGVAGLVLAVGGYLEHFPEAMIADADRLGFPLIELPWEVPFEDVVLAISARVIDAQNLLLRRSGEIHDRLTQRVLQGGGFADVAADLMALCGRPALIVDSSYALLSAPLGAGAGLVTSIGEDDRLPAALGEYLSASASMLGAAAPSQARRLTARPDLGLIADCLVASIVVGRQTLGYVVTGSGPDGSDELDAVAVERTATVAALLLFKQRAVREAERRLEGSLIERLLGAAPLDAAATAAGQRHGFDPAQRHAVALLHSGSADLAALPLALRAALARQRQPRLFEERDGSLVFFLAAHDGDVEEAARRVMAEIATDDARLAVGRIGGVTHLPASYDQAREALIVAVRVGLTQPVTHFDDLGLLHWLRVLPDAQRADNAFTRKVSSLAAHDAARGANLLATLESYLHHGGAIGETAAALGIHRHTLAYRLDRIASLCAVDLSSELTRLNLHVALLERRLGDSSQ